MNRKLVLLEANEIPARILDGYVARQPQSALAQMLPHCQRYATHASDTCSLSPWITWPTLHRGVNNDVHGLMHFGQDLTTADERYPPIWELLVEAGVSTGVFGPLHSWPIPNRVDRYDFFLPDTFAADVDSHPRSIEAFQAFNLAMARQSPRNVSRSLDLPTLISFLTRAPMLGLRPKTAFSILGQLIDERRETWKSTRRRTFQPVVAFDLYMKQLKRKKPEFSNFFTNHVASAMHRYWAALHPEDFEELELGVEWQRRFEGEIDFAMGWADQFFNRLANFADRNPEYLVVVASSMGQESAHGERLDSQLYLRHPELLLECAGFSGNDWERRPSMDPKVSLLVSVEKSAAFEEFVKRITIAGKPLFYTTEEKGFFDLAFGQPNLDPAIDKILLDGSEVTFESLGFELTEVEDGAGSTGYHQPEGILLIYDPQNRGPHSQLGTISTTEIAPAILDHFQVQRPTYMSNESGLSLLG